MTDITPDEVPVPDAPRLAYPDTTVGMLMKQRDESLANAQAAQAGIERYARLVQEAQGRVGSLQQAIDAMGGDQPMITIPDPNAPQDTLDPSE